MLLQTNLPYLRKPCISIKDGDDWLELHPQNKAEVLTGRFSDRASAAVIDHTRAIANQRKIIARDKRISAELARIARREKRK